MKIQVAILGLGRFGIGLANTLLSMGYDVLAMDVGVVGIFSDWPATGTCFASCMGLR